MLLGADCSIEEYMINKIWCLNLIEQKRYIKMKEQKLANTHIPNIEEESNICKLLEKWIMKLASEENDIRIQRDFPYRDHGTRTWMECFLPGAYSVPTTFKITWCLIDFEAQNSISVLYIFYKSKI